MALWLLLLPLRLALFVPIFVAYAVTGVPDLIGEARTFFLRGFPTLAVWAT